MKIDATPWPLIAITMVGELRADALDPLFQAFDTDFFKRGTPYVIVADTRGVTNMPDALWRTRLTRWMNQPHVRSCTERYNVGTVTIFTSSIMRGVYTALTWIWKAPSPQHAAGNMAEALEWCRGRLESARVPLTPKLREFYRANGVSWAG